MEYGHDSVRKDDSRLLNELVQDVGKIDTVGRARLASVAGTQ